MIYNLTNGSVFSNINYANEAEYPAIDTSYVPRIEGQPAGQVHIHDNFNNQKVAIGLY
jgi:hypothetical protein